MSNIIRNTTAAVGISLGVSATALGAARMAAVWPKQLGKVGHFSVQRDVLQAFPGMKFLILSAKGVKYPSDEKLEVINKGYEEAQERIKGLELSATNFGGYTENVSIWLDQLGEAGVEKDSQERGHPQGGEGHKDKMDRHQQGRR